MKFRYEFNFLLEKGFLEDFFGADDIRLYSVVVVVAFSFVFFSGGGRIIQESTYLKLCNFKLEFNSHTQPQNTSEFL